MLEYVNVSSWKNRAVAEKICKLNWGNTGTAFRLYGFHDEWNEKTMKKLKNHLENLLPPDVVKDFDIYFFDDTTSAENAKIVSAHIDSYDYKIQFWVEEDQLQIMNLTLGKRKIKFLEMLILMKKSRNIFME